MTLEALYKTASILEKRGKTKDAIIVYQHVLGKRVEILGANHPATITATRKLDALAEKLKRRKELSDMLFLTAIILIIMVVAVKVISI